MCQNSLRSEFKRLVVGRLRLGEATTPVEVGARFSYPLVDRPCHVVDILFLLFSVGFCA
jgi:hypothetical protein